MKYSPTPSNPLLQTRLTTILWTWKQKEFLLQVFKFLYDNLYLELNGTFKTPGAELTPYSFSFALSSCAKTGSNSEV